MILLGREMQEGSIIQFLIKNLWQPLFKKRVKTELFF